MSFWSAFGFVTFLFIVQVNKFVKKYGQGSTREVLEDLIATGKQAHALSKEGPQNRQKAEAVMKDFARRRFPNLENKLMQVDKSKNVIDVKSDLQQKWQSQVKSSVVGKQAPTMTQVFGGEAIQPDRGIGRIVLVVFLVFMFLGIGVGLARFFGFGF